MIKLKGAEIIQDRNLKNAMNHPSPTSRSLFFPKPFGLDPATSLFR